LLRIKAGTRYDCACIGRASGHSSCPTSCGCGDSLFASFACDYIPLLKPGRCRGKIEGAVTFTGCFFRNSCSATLTNWILCCLNLSWSFWTLLLTFPHSSPLVIERASSDLSTFS